LNDGVWDGRQIVPAEWVAASVQKQVEAGMLDYGYQWWIHPTLDAYAAIGREAQLIFVMPDRDIVVVFTAQLDSADVLFDLIEDYVVPATDMVTNIDGNAIGTTSPATLNTSAERMPKYQWAYNGDGDLDAIAVNPETGHIVWLNEMD
jgi:CubicO group peptidase (beta-lactamase class C family)